MEDCGCIPIMIENNIMWLEGRGSISIKDDDVCTINLSGFCLGKASPKDFLSKVWQKSFSQATHVGSLEVYDEGCPVGSL